MAKSSLKHRKTLCHGSTSRSAAPPRYPWNGRVLPRRTGFAHTQLPDRVLGQPGELAGGVGQRSGPMLGQRDDVEQRLGERRGMKPGGKGRAVDHRTAGDGVPDVARDQLE